MPASSSTSDPPAKRQKLDENADSSAARLLADPYKTIVKNSGASATISRLPNGAEKILHETSQRRTYEAVYAKTSQRCVAKEFKELAEGKDAYQAEQKNFQFAVVVLNEFLKNSSTAGPQVSLKIHEPSVWTYEDGHSRAGGKTLVEPFLPMFNKFNSNTGVSTFQHKAPDALTHFSYHFSKGEKLLCGLQGQVADGVVNVRYTFSGVSVCSMERSHGETDMGPAAMEEFFRTHKCSEFCSPGWKKWDGGARTSSSGAGAGNGGGASSSSRASVDASGGGGGAFSNLGDDPNFVPSMRTRLRFDVIGAKAGVANPFARTNKKQQPDDFDDGLSVSEDEDEDNKEEE